MLKAGCADGYSYSDCGPEEELSAMAHIEIGQFEIFITEEPCSTYLEVYVARSSCLRADIEAEIGEYRKHNLRARGVVATIVG